MYAAHFGLKKNLFDAGIAHDAAVFRSAAREPITANLAIALAAPDAVVTLSGTPGVGKTTLISAALRASSTRLALAWLNGMPTNATELLELLLVEFGLTAERATRIERLQIWRQFLSEMSATESRVFVVVERAEDLAPEVLRALDALTATDTNGCTGAHVVLLGNEGLDEHLSPPLLESLRQRIRLRQRLVPFTLTELEEYLRHHVGRAGGEFERVFATGAVAALHRYSSGIARVVNNLCETALTLAATEGQPTLTPELVATTAVGWLGAVSAQATQAPAAPAPLAASSPATHALGTVATIDVVAAAAPAPRPDQPATAVPPAEEATDSEDFTATDYDFDGGATDIPEVAMTDFPVLTDAVDEPAHAGATLPAAISLPPQARAPSSSVTPAQTTAAAPTTPLLSAALPTAATKPAPPPAPTARIDTAYAPKRESPATPSAPKAAPTTTLPAAAKPTAAPANTSKPLPVADEGDADELRQTQTMRAISIAKSIDDISSSMAETLFGEADLDMLSAALASAGWSEEEPATATPQRQERREQEPPRPAPAAPVAVDDPFDLFDLGPNAPLELIEDLPPPPDAQRRKAATQR